MVSWGRAFKGAAGIIGFAIIWWIVGLILIVVGFMLSGIGYLFGFGSTYGAGASYASMVMGFILVFIGYLIGILGTIAAFLKVLPEIIAEEVRGL